MVQRKVANKKLGIQAEDIKSEKLVVSLKPSCAHNLQDIKNKGADLKKKKMKKSGSIKRPDVEILRSSGLRKRVELPGKPPPVVLQTAAATPKKQSPVKGGEDVTPNYMKSTSSSDARKERAQVSSQSPQTTSPDRKRHSKNNTAPGNKPARTLARASSLKLVRTLTKTPSFKLSRGPAKRHSQVILCENLDVQKATCSSTMKEHTFPDHLALSPGATEAEGRSALKVCTYSYCSLNGHHHQPLPPLKSFLSARRRMLKGQRNLKIGCLSPRRANPVRDILKEIEAAQVNNEAEPSPEECGTSSTSSQLKQEGSEGFFVEIYSKEREDTSLKKQDISDSSVADVEPPIGVGDGSKTGIDQVEKSSPSKLLGFEVDYEHGSADHSQDVNFVDMDVDDYSEENNNGKIAEEIYPPFLAEGKTLPDFLNLIYELEAEYTPSIQSEEAELDTSDMDWEAGLDFSAYPHDPTPKSIQINQMIDLERANSALDNAYLDEFAAESGENLPDEISQEPIDDETASDDEAFKRTSLIVEENEGSTQKDLVESMVPGVGSLATPQQEDVPARQMGNEEHHEISDYVVENISNSIGIQTDAEFEDPRDISGGVDEVQKRSIGIQTDEIEESQSDAVREKGTLTNKDDAIVEEEIEESVSALITVAETECSMTLLDSGDTMEHPSLPDHDEIQPITLLSGALQDEVQDLSSATQSTLGYDDLDSSENKNDETTKATDLASTEDQTHVTAPSSSGETDQNFHKTQFDNAEDSSTTRIKVEPIGSHLNEELAISRIITKGTSREIAESDELTEFNPRAPNFLPIQPVPEAEKVDLKHLDLDENKNTDEWMLDHALQQAVTKLAPARKRKVALLVEAFETVLPVSKCETRRKHTSPALSNVRSIQACS